MASVSRGVVTMGWCLWKFPMSRNMGEALSYRTDLDQENQLWSLFWVKGRTQQEGCAPMHGRLCAVLGEPLHTYSPSCIQVPNWT